jgi:autotransporter translocation and assembly factor TamB
MAARRIAATASAVTLGCVATVLGAAAVLAIVGLTTTAGARFALAAAERFVPGELEVGAVAGSVAGGLALTNLRYESPSVVAQLQRLEVELAAAKEWLGSRVVLERLVLAGGSVSFREPPGETGGVQGASAPEPAPLPSVPSWLEVRSLRAADLELTEPAAVLTELDMSIAGPRVGVRRIDARYGNTRIEGEAELRVDGAVSGRIEASFAMLAAAEQGAQSVTAEALRAVLTAGVQVTGTSDDLRVEVAWEPLVVHAADADWTSERGTLRAELDGGVLTIGRFAADVLGGHVAGSGVVDVAALAGHASVDYESLDTSQILARLDGRVSGSAVAAFASVPALVAGGAAVTEGTIAGEALAAQLQARLRDGTAYVDRARVTLARGAVEATGTIAAQHLDVAFDARIPELGTWYPPAAGEVVASGSVVGPRSDPALDARLRAERLRLEGVPPVEMLELTVSGTAERHLVHARAVSTAGTFDTRVQQGWNGERLAGTVLDSSLVVARAGDWLLTAPAAYSVAASSQSLERACYAGPAGASLCAAFAAGTLQVDADDVPAALAAAATGSDARLIGAADLALRLQLEPHVEGSFTLTQPELGLRPSAGSEDAPGAELAAVENVSLTGTLTPTELALELTAALAATGDPIGGHLNLAPPSAAGALDAALTARLSSLSALGALVEDVDELDGSVVLELRATGTPEAPVLDGIVTAESVGAAVPALGIELSRGQISARADGASALAVEASICSSGCLELNGNVDLRLAEGDWELDAVLRGDRFVLADLPDFHAVIAPNLTVDATPERWLVDGELVIEQGLLAVEDIPAGAARPVAETVIHGADAATEAGSEAPLPFVANVAVRLGEVRFAGLGVSAELDGMLDVERTIDGQLLANGTTSIEEGTFSAYGQELTIERGDLLFTGPTDNPALDIRATREVEGATVGLAIMGTLRNPQSEVFSTPALDETEALARLITGRSLQNATPADGDAIGRAALGLGIRRALPALDRLGSRLGLDELGVDSAGSENGALVAGRQLGEDVYLRYKHGLFDDFAGLELIYRLTERFRLRTETGTSQSLDLIYERNPRDETALSETESPFDDQAPARPPASEPQAAPP